MSQSDFVTRGQALVNSGQYQEAVKVCRLGLLGRPTTVEGRLVLGAALLALKRYDEVLAEMRVALELDHSSIGAQVLKGEAMLGKSDAHGAIEVLEKVRVQAPTDPKIDSLLELAKRSLGKPATISASHPSVGFVGQDSADHTRNYPNHAHGGGDLDIDEPTGDGFMQPTAVSTPKSKKQSSARPAALPDPTPPPNVLAVGDKSGTVEVDPEAEGVELDDDDDFGAVVAPPRSGVRPVEKPLFSMGGKGLSSRRDKAGGGGLPTPGIERHKKRSAGEISSVELIDDDLVEVDSGDSVSGETLLPVDRKQVAPGPGTRVRNAVSVPSGPLDISRPAATRPTALDQPVVPAHLAQMLANAPADISRPQPTATVRGNPGGPPAGPIAAAMPTMAAVPPPPSMTTRGLGGLDLPPSGASNPNAVRPTLAIPAPPAPAPAWAQRTVAANQQVHQSLTPAKAHADEPTSRPQPLDPKIEALFEESNAEAAVSSVAKVIEPSHSGVRAMKTGMRKGRSKLQIAIWLLIGGLVIAGGVFVGFKFRAMRLEKKIADTRDVALGFAKADTWKGHVRARDRLAGIAQASPTPDNKAALARTRALIAFEFGDGIVEAKAAVEGLGAQGTIDAEIAATYLALAQHDVKAALNAADRAAKLGTDDPAVPYVTGQAHLIAGDPTTAIEHLKKAADREGRPLYLVALARAYGEVTDWAAATKLLDPAKVKAWFDGFDPDIAKEVAAIGLDIAQLSADHPNVAIDRAQLLVASGKVGGKGQEVRGALERVVAEGAKPINDQTRGVSPTQIAFAHLAMAVLDFHLANKKAPASFNAALAVGLDDQRFAEAAIETLYLTTDFARARTAADRTLTGWPNSRRARITLAKVLLAQGKASEAQDAIAKLPDVEKLGRSLAIRGQVRLALGALDEAKADFDRALAQVGKQFEDALVGRAWVDMRTGDFEGARNRLRERFQQSPSTPVTIAWAAILMTGKAEDKKTAKAELERVVNGPVSLDTWRAQLQLARIDREIGDEGAKVAYSKAFELTGSIDIRIETATYLIEYRRPTDGYDMLEELLKSTQAPTGELLLEAARANLLVGKHARGAELLDKADKVPNLVRWKYERERGRLALRKGAYNEAATALEAALDKCGDDVETFYLAAETAVVDDKKPNQKLVDKVKKLGPERFKDKPEAKLIEAKLLSSRDDVAGKLYDEAKAAIGDAASPRRRSVAVLGRGIVAYNKDDDPVALNALDLAFTLDPTLYEAYLYWADIQRQKDTGANRDANLKGALEKAQKAIEFNPDYLDGYVMAGQIAHKLGNRKLVAEMVTKVNALAPQSEQLKTLQALR